MSATIETGAADREISATRTFDAPRELVFDAWTDAEHISQWWGPQGFRTTTEVMDVRAGGEWRFVMHGPDGRDYPNRVIYLEVTRPTRLVYRHADDGQAEPVNFHVTVTFGERADGRTVVDVHMQFPSVAERDRVAREYGAVEGLHDTLERLASMLSKENAE